MEYEPQELEERWRSRWRSEGLYEADPSPDGDPVFITVPYPYPSGGMHIGHARTYTVPDTWARYRRLQGDNVLFPIAWHVTGTPIIGAVERLKKGEEAQLSVLRDTYGVPESELQELETPMGFARYFIENHYKQGMRDLGLSIDWRREFTTNDERYKQFISWQYETLRDHGLLEQGMHPVKYCMNEEQPVTTHDLLEGEEADFQEYTLIRFEWDGMIVPMATLRPETVRGVTNAYIDPVAEYAFASVDDERWFISVEAAEKFELQGRSVRIERVVPGKELVNELVKNPITGEEVLVLPASFVDPDNATGVVMSVPGHSPDDWIALEEAKNDPSRMETYGIDPREVKGIEPRSIIDIDGYGPYPAQDTIEEFGIEQQGDPRLKAATQELYNREFHQGILKELYGEYAGMVVEEARSQFRADYLAEGAFDTMHEFTEEVVCRCGGDVEVATQETWFLRYNDPEWKTVTKEVVSGLDAIPENSREEYLHTIDWLKEWPCIRNYGLGTRLPWDRDFLIEPLSDSTIYMCYYTVAHRIQSIPPDQLDRAFFDTLFYGAAAVDDPDERALELREEWDYWYPVDYRCSANDLISNHLTFYLYHHADLFSPEKWPQGITIMGMGLLEGEKMSSSKGHVVLPDEAIDRYGADTVRFFLLNSAEPWQDYNWRADQVATTRNQLDRFWRQSQELITGPGGDPELSRIDRWLLSKFQQIVRTATTGMDQFETRTASQTVFYESEDLLRWYRRRTDTDRAGARWTLREVLRLRLIMLSPFIPFMTNELYLQLTDQSLSQAAWPQPDPAIVSDRIELEEDLIRVLVDDIREVIDVTGTDPQTIHVYTAADWKYQVFNETVEIGPAIGDVMGQVMQYEELRDRGQAVNDLVGTLVDYVRDSPDERLEIQREIEETEVYERASQFLAGEFEASIEVSPEEDAVDPGNKASDAVPFRPAIYIE